MSTIVIDRAVVEQAMKAMLNFPGDISDEMFESIIALKAALAQQDEPVESVARECSDPMCACRGGPCAECEEGEREKEIEDLRSSLYFYQRRCEALQSWQSKMRDPERTIVCDILANGKTLDPAVAGNRYTTPQQAEPAQEPVAWRFEARHIDTAWGPAVSLKRPGPEHKYMRNVIPLYAAPPHQKQVGWMQKSTGVIRCDWGFDTTGYVPVYAVQEQSE